MLFHILKELNHNVKELGAATRILNIAHTPSIASKLHGEDKHERKHAIASPWRDVTWLESLWGSLLSLLRAIKASLLILH